MYNDRGSNGPLGAAASSAREGRAEQDAGLFVNGLKHVKRLVVLVIGGTVLLAGILMLVLPGPGLVVIPIGLGILAIEFAWARLLLRKFKEKGMNARDALRGKRSDNAPNRGGEPRA